MKSINFEHLRTGQPELAELGAFAEAYVYQDPQSSLIKQRLFCEQLVKAVLAKTGQSIPFDASFLDLLERLNPHHTSASAVPTVVVDTLHLIRKRGNKAAHGTTPTPKDALDLLKSTAMLGGWYHIAFLGGKQGDLAAFHPPAAEPVDSKGALKREKKALLEQLRAKEDELAQHLFQLEETRQQLEVQAKSKAELQQMLATAQKAADALKFDEATTRKELIDVSLTDAGWQFGHGHAAVGKVEREVPVKHQPTKTSDGSADYVQWDDNHSPLGVIEAKKTAVDPARGREQARIYADGLEKEHGQRPVIFYSNGFETFIWDDKNGYPPRPIFGLYSKDSLQYLIHQRSKKALDGMMPDKSIPLHFYQIEAIKRVALDFQNKKRKALIVMATGTGKTRVAIALTKLLIDAGWVKRVLFLCDRKELRKQARDAFAEHLPSEPAVVVNAGTCNERKHRVYLATYPAMMKYFESYDVGFFDLIIADESHRSIYNRYRDLFLYFDSLQVGLTATPVHFINRNTYALFNRDDADPTFNYDYAMALKENKLVPFEVVKAKTLFQRTGMRYPDMTRDQRLQAEAQSEDPNTIDFDPRELDSLIFNKDTNRKVLRNLMESGIRHPNGTLGKSIIFARSQTHAKLLGELFEEMYPQYGGSFCRVIHSGVERVEQLIDDLKDPDNPLTIGVSVDMLDTGIDIPEVVNLVFAKPVKSYVKFWQMIGRGTRLCHNLFGPGQDKSKFLIFDHWGNFEYFENDYKEHEPSGGKALAQRTFEARVQLAETALARQDVDTFRYVLKLIEADIRDLPEGTVSVKEKWRVKKTLEVPENLHKFTAEVRNGLRFDLAPLMQWRNIQGQSDAIQFDLLVVEAQNALLEGSSSLDGVRDQIRNALATLPVQLAQVEERIKFVKQGQDLDWWFNITVPALDELRSEVRGIFRFRDKMRAPASPRPVFDIKDGEVESEPHLPKLDGLQLHVYRQRVLEVLARLFETHPALKKIRQGLAATKAEVKDLAEQVHLTDPNLDLDELLTQFPNSADRLDLAIRRVVGMDADAVKQHFEAFISKYPEMSPHQVRFMAMLQSHIAQHGALEIERLYAPPFTNVNADGPEGVFEETQVDELIDIIRDINGEKKG
ncbi:MAG: DEAD/DEAH box helicase family protein [Planctomycetes bacterium]|nr:DEAD/DEAH box helicase family protein [Planctomycetota bacterium]